MPSSPRPARRSDAFTILEILVTCAVLALLTTILAGLFSNFVGLTDSSTDRIESGNESRTIFDRLAFDLDASVRRGGIGIEFLKNSQAVGSVTSPNDAIRFLAATRTTSAASRFARIGYEVGEATSTSPGYASTALLRCAEPFLWTDDVTRVDPSAAADLQPLGRGVFRLELAFLTTDGTLVATPPPADEISAVVCATASLDADSLAKLTSAQRASLATALLDAANGSAPSTAWTVDDFSAYPPFVGRNVRFNQRYLPLP